MKVICIHPRLASLSSHHFNEAQGFIEEFSRRKRDFELLVSVHAPASIVAQLDAQPVIDDPTFRVDLSFEERRRRFVAILHEHLDRQVDAGDIVLLTVATQLETYSLVHWLSQLRRRQKPWVVILFLSDRWNRSGQAEHERQLGEFRALRQLISSLAPRDARRVIFFAATESLADELTGLLGAPTSAAPMPLPYPPLDEIPAATVSSRPRVAVLGGLRGEKGSRLLPAIIRACRSRTSVEFLVQLANNTLTDDELAELERLVGQPEVRVIDRPITRPEYYAAVGSADLGLFPYEVVPYRQRTSGVFAEMVAFGKPVVVTRGTWLAAQVQAGRAAGIVSDPDPVSFAQAVATCVSELTTMTRSAQAVSSAWRETISLPAFVDLVDATIAARAGAQLMAGGWSRFWRRAA